MPFGLCNDPARLLNSIFRDHLGKIVVMYLDNILILSTTWEDHLQHVRTVLELLRLHKLQVKRSKSYFGQTSIPYLGFVIYVDGVSPDLKRAKHI